MLINHPDGVDGGMRDKPLWKFIKVVSSVIAVLAFIGWSASNGGW
jgi:hypothetical protein